ncbi:proline-rich protein 19 [Spea bombifrons]|uniref:proline-rich protein 19 n=1 Tax=Spea bombifrons TaxID=233779 RepID=UPI00234BED40|nr:proline-rich protein 19 [Spea bombifrons]XP_053308070.1 proline-rich protein 19 [Spea bombifrons]
MNTDSGFFPRGPTSSSAGLETKTCPVSEDLRNVHQSGSNAILKVKRRKTKRERNNAKFHKSEAEKFPKMASRYFLQKQNSAFHSFCLGTVQPAAITGACSNSNPVIITQNRLSQHLGMFNREVKSVDIGRLLSQDQKDKVDGDINESTADVEKNIDPGSMAVDPNNTPRIESQENLGNASPKLMGSETKTQVMEPSSDLPQTKDQEDCILCGEDSSVHRPTTPASSGATTRTADKQDIPVQEVAEMIIKTLNPQVLFPGRDLLNETRKSIMEKVMQYRTSNTSARRRLDYSSTVNVDICDGSDWGRIFEEGTEDRSSGADPQITKPAEPKTSTPFLSPSGDNASHTIIKRASDAPSHKKPTELFHQPITFSPDFDRQGLNRCRHMYDAESPRMSTWPRAEPELAFDNRSRLQRDTESFLKSMRQRKILDSHGTAGRPQEWKRTQDDFQISAPHATCSHRHGSRNHSSPNLWEFPVGVPLQEIFPNPEAQAGLKIRHGSGGENQTAYDVLSSIWSHDIDRSPLSQIPANFPDVSPKQTRLCYGDRGRQRVRSGGKFHTFHGLPPGDFEPQPSIGLSDFMFEDGEGQQQSDVQKHGAQGLETDIRFQEDPPPPTTLSQWRGIFEASHDEPWSPSPAVNMDSVDNVWSRDWRRRDQWSDQLPITLFPPSESLEQENPSVSLPFERSFRQTQLSRLSPDNWVFPRMKLY